MPWFKRPIFAWLTFYALTAALLVAVMLIIYGSQKAEGHVWPATRFAMIIGALGIIAGIVRLVLDLRNPEMRKHLLTPTKPSDEKTGKTPPNRTP